MKFWLTMIFVIGKIVIINREIAIFSNDFCPLQFLDRSPYQSFQFRDTPVVEYQAHRERHTLTKIMRKILIFLEIFFNENISPNFPMIYVSAVKYMY